MRPTERCINLASFRLDAINKRFQEQRGGAAAAHPTTRLERSLCQLRYTKLKKAKNHVAQVRIRRMNLWAVFVINGQAPESIVFGLPGDA